MFQDIKNILNKKTFDKLTNALNCNKPICFSRIINNNKYIYRTEWRDNRKGIIIRNITKCHAIALIIDSEACTDYNILINAIQHL